MRMDFWEFSKRFIKKDDFLDEIPLDNIGQNV